MKGGPEPCDRQSASVPGLIFRISAASGGDKRVLGWYFISTDRAFRDVGYQRCLGECIHILEVLLALLAHVGLIFPERTSSISDRWSYAAIKLAAVKSPFFRQTNW